MSDDRRLTSGSWRDVLAPEIAALFEETVQAVIQVSGRDFEAVSEIAQQVAAGKSHPHGRAVEAIYLAGPGELVDYSGWVLLIQAFLITDRSTILSTGEVLRRWIGSLWELGRDLHFHGACSPDEMDHFSEIWTVAESGLVVRNYGDLDVADGRAAHAKLVQLTQGFTSYFDTPR